MSKDLDRSDSDACIQYMKIAMGRIKAEQAKDQANTKPNYDLKEVADQLAPFPETDSTAYAQARIRLRANDFQGKGYHSMVAIKGALDAIGEGHYVVKPDVFEKLQSVIADMARTTEAPYLFDVLHPQVGLLRRRAPRAEPHSFLKEMLNTRK